MTKAKFKYDNQSFRSFEISGHAEYNEEGLDIVCAGISATVITSLNLLLKLLGKKAKFSEVQEDGYMYFEIIDKKLEINTNYFVELVIENLILSLQEIEETYPNHLKIKIEK